MIKDRAAATTGRTQIGQPSLSPTVDVTAATATAATMTIDNFTFRLVNAPRGDDTMLSLSDPVAHRKGVADSVDGADQVGIELASQGSDV